MDDMNALKAALRRAVRALPALECEGLANALGVDTRDCGAGDDVCEACMLEVADAIAARMMPEGIEWPRFEDGGFVLIGDEVDSPDGPFEVFCVRFTRDGFEVSDPGRFKTFDASFGDALERFDRHDTQERIDADALKQDCKYWGCVGKTCNRCPSLIHGKTPKAHYGTSDCFNAMKLDLLRRQRELCARENGGVR